MEQYPYLEARHGREKQKYDGETRLVIGYVVSDISKHKVCSNSRSVVLTSIVTQYERQMGITKRRLGS